MIYQDPGVTALDCRCYVSSRECVLGQPRVSGQVYSRFLATVDVRIYLQAKPNLSGYLLELIC
jgi:hypothetical protein